MASWKGFCESAHPENDSHLLPWKRDLTRVQELIILRCLRPDKVRQDIVKVMLLTVNQNNIYIYIIYIYILYIYIIYIYIYIYILYIYIYTIYIYIYI